ncbi:MAG: hypothetical protein EBR52_09795 [Microbacteriaceae bacterium]|nr:hypothetical protein [Microbacteriaceae bacterium]
MTSESLPLWFDLLAMSIAALFGGALARSRNFPIYGTLFAGVVSGLGGGMLRDMLLGKEPVAISNWIFIPTILVATVLGALLFHKLIPIQNYFLVMRSLALGCLVAIGSQVALNDGVPFASVVFLGIGTATFGGIIVDVVANQRATIARQAHWFGSGMLVGAVVFAVVSFYINFWLAVFLCIITVFCLSFFSVKRNWPSPMWPGQDVSSTS